MGNNGFQTEKNPSGGYDVLVNGKREAWARLHDTAQEMGRALLG